MVDSTVLTPKQLAERWQICLTKIYEDNNAGKLPHLENNKNRFPLAAIEAMEREMYFNKYDIKTPRERRLENELVALKQENEKLKDILSQALSSLAPVINL